MCCSLLLLLYECSCFNLLGLLSLFFGATATGQFLPVERFKLHSRRYGIFQLKTILMIVIIWNFFFIPVSFILQVKTSDGWGGPEVQAEKKRGKQLIKRVISVCGLIDSETIKVTPVLLFHETSRLHGHFFLSLTVRMGPNGQKMQPAEWTPGRRNGSEMEGFSISV